MNNSGGDNFKDRQMELLMEKLRNKANHLKPWNESIKGMRVALMDKRYVLDSNERLQLQKCLDTLQKSIKVTSIQSMVERLESITRQLGLKFTAGPSGIDCFISSDMFYVEVLLELTGTVKDVKIAHHGDPVSCTELSEVLSRGDFVEFTKHLEGLAAIYQLNADKKQKSKAYMALQALETDLSMLAQLQSSINDPTNLVHKSPVGILQPRKGGHPMKLTYFISPYDLLDVKTKSSIPLTVENVIEKQLGHCVTVCIESSTAHKLQTQSLMSISRTPDGKSLPSFAAPSNLNSTTLPASFVLKLATPMPISTALVKKIQSVTSIECADMSLSEPLLSLITKHASGGELDCNNNKGLFVVLPDQHHCYYLSGAADLQGLMVTSIPFTHPTHVPQILVFLRQQMLFNVLISSCIRTCSKQDVDNPLVFEVTALSWLHISVSFEHPMEESMATAEFDLSDITNVKCKLYTMSNEVSICSDEYASKVVQRCLSIPVTMRAVIRKAQGQQQKSNHSNEDMFMAMGSSGKYSNQPHGFSESSSGSKFVADFDVKLGRSGNASDGQGINKLDVLSSTINTSAYGVSSPDVGSNPLGLDSQAYIDSSTSSPAPGDLFPLAPERTGGVLHSGRFSQAASAPSAQTQAKTSVSSLINEGGHGQLITKPRKDRGKRKTVGESSSGSARNNTKHSPKHKLNEDDFSKDLPTPDVDSNGSLSITFGMGLELSASASNDGTNMEGESHVGKLASSLDTMIKYEGGSNRTSGEASASSDSELQTSSSSVQDIMEKSGCDQSNTDSDLFSANQGRNSATEFQFKTEPMDFDTEVLNNQSSSFDEELMDTSDDFNLEHLGINTSIISKVPLNLNIEKTKESKKKKIKLEKEQNSSSGIEEKPLPVILDIISSQEVKLIEPNKSSTVAEIAEKRPNVEIIPIGTVPPSSTSSSLSTSSSSLHGSSIKIVKSDNKSGQREIRRGVSMSERSDKRSKGESKRKRKHADAMNSSDEKPTKIFELSITALPPQSSTNDKTLPVIKTSEPSVPKSIMLSVKSITSPTTVTSTPSVSKTQLSSSKKPQLPAGTTVSPTKPISILKTSQSKPKSSSLKPSSSSSKNLQGIGSDSKSSSPGSNKTTISPIKFHNKLKSSSSSSSGNSSGSSSNSKQGNQSPSVQRGSSPSKVSTKAATVKLKQLNIPSSTTVTPLSKSTSSSAPGATLTSPTSNPTPTTPTATPTSNLASSPSTPTASATKAPSLPIPSSTPTSTASGSSGSNNGSNSNGGNNSSCSKSNKVVNRSRKGSLSAVIDKLMASNRQNSGPPGEGSAQIPDKKSDLGKSEEKKDVKSEKKESHKESSSIQKSNDKSKSSSSDQKTSDKKPEFTVKQSSQGIKLTVTKTRSVEGSTKLSSSIKTGSSKLSSKSLSSSSLNNSRPSGLSGSATGLKPGVNSGPASKKIGSSSSNSKSSSNSSSGGSNSLSGQNKSSPVHKSPGGSGSVSKGSSSSSSFKPSPKHSSSSSSNSSSSSVLTTTTTTVTSTSTLSCASVTDSKSHLKTQEKTGKSPVQESKPSTPKGEKGSGGGSITSMPPPPPPPPPPPVPLSETMAQSRKIEESSGRPSSVRQSPKHNRDLQPDETEAERKFRLLLAQTKMESQTTSLTTTTSSNTTKSTANSNILGSSAVDRPEGARTPKLELPDKSPKHSSSGAPKTPTSEKSSVNLVNSKPVPMEPKRPSTPKSGDNSSKASDIPSSPMEPSPSSKQNLKPKTKRQASPSLDDLSSPEDNLIIDCPSTPHQKSDKKLAKSSTEPSTPTTKSPPDKATSSPLLTVKSPANPSPSLKSPLIIGTPHSDHSNPSSIAHSSPCVIDDDLMDEALVGVGK